MNKLSKLLKDPVFLKNFHLYCTIGWIPFTLLAGLLGWLQSVTFVSYMSMLALFLGSFSAYQASRTEVRQEEINNE